VRFAPSPTGYLHVGGARTALFNWLFARNQKGKFILRIEDTDVERSQESMVQGIIDGLTWLGLDWDEGPFFQSQRLEQYQSAARRLVDQKKAYPCYCTTEELTAKRAVAVDSKQDPKYDGTCRLLSPEHIQEKEKQGTPHTIRFKVPERGILTFTDEVFGKIETDLGTLEDFVLMRSDGMPTYHLGVVVDDIDMRITHVIRGADHISNTPKQVLLYQALQSELPSFAHVPLILGPDKTRLSKRHGATSVTAYREMGFLAPAFRNYLALLGWAPREKREIFSTEELVKHFSLEGVSRANAVFALEKLEWMNAQYIASLSSSDLFPLLREELVRQQLWDEAFDTGRKEWFLALIDLLKPRAKTLSTFVRNGRPFLSDQYEIEEAAREKFLKDPILPSILPELASRYEELQDFNLAGTEITLRQLAETRQVKAGVLINAARVLLTGQAVAPGIFEVMVMLGQQKTIQRLSQVIKP
jgi:glutamyl-tRNA synthetase